jgi:hypothetical protein
MRVDLHGRITLFLSVPCFLVNGSVLFSLGIRYCLVNASALLFLGIPVVSFDLQKAHGGHIENVFMI